MKKLLKDASLASLGRVFKRPHISIRELGRLLVHWPIYGVLSKRLK